MGNGVVSMFWDTTPQSLISWKGGEIRLIELPEDIFLEEYLFVCAQSWKDIMASTSAPNGPVPSGFAKESSCFPFFSSGCPQANMCPGGIIDSEPHKSGTDLFLDSFEVHLVSSCINEKVVKLLNRGSDNRGCCLVFFMLRFVLGLRNKSMKAILKKVRTLGREHLRLNIGEDDMYDFCEVVLMAIKERMGSRQRAVTIYAWMFVFKFLVTEMMGQKYTFQRTSTDRVAPHSETSLRSSTADIHAKAEALNMLHDEICNRQQQRQSAPVTMQLEQQLLQSQPLSPMANSSKRSSKFQLATHMAESAESYQVRQFCAEDVLECSEADEEAEVARICQYEADRLHQIQLNYEQCYFENLSDS